MRPSLFAAAAVAVILFLSFAFESDHTGIILVVTIIGLMAFMAFLDALDRRAG